MADITMPQLGETVTEGTITRWFKQVGDAVAVDEVLYEVSTDKVDTEVTSSVAGVLSEIVALEGDVVEVGQVLARIGDDASSAGGSSKQDTPAASTPGVPTHAAHTSPAHMPDASTPGVPTSAVSTSSAPAFSTSGVPTSSAPAAPTSAAPTSAAPTSAAPAPVAPTPAAPIAAPIAAPSSSSSTTTSQLDSVTASDTSKGLVLSPIVRRLITENDIDPSGIVGTGIGGRIRRADIEQVIRARARAEPQESKSQGASSSTTSTSADSAGEVPSTQPSDQQPSTPPPPVVGKGYRQVPLNNIRRLTADHMVMSQQVSPHVLTAVEVDFEAVERVRKSVREDWKAEEGFSLTYLPFIARAVVDALRDFPYLNASFGDDHLIVHRSVNLAIAVDLDFQGLLAPVIPGVEGKRLRQIARDIVDVASRARNRRLKPQDLSNGTFTITNAGQYGTMMQFPIINQPQVAILSTDGISRKPVVVTDSYGAESIAIHSVGVLAMAWDHRAFDGAYAAAFLQRISSIISNRDWLTEIR